MVKIQELTLRTVSAGCARGGALCDRCSGPRSVEHPELSDVPAFKSGVGRACL